MRLIQCNICSIEFCTNHSQGKYCSDKCRRQGKRNRERKWAQKERKHNPEKHRAAKARQYQRIKQDAESYEQHLNKGRRWRRNNLERAREFSRRWIANNKDWMIARNANRRHNREPLEQKTIVFVFKRDNYTCQYCGRQDDLTLDHIIPLVNGGSNNKGNLCVACRTCNCSKGAKTAEEFLAYLKEVKC